MLGEASFKNIGRFTQVSIPNRMAQATRSTGVVKWFSPQKGYGFITMDDGDSLFVHQSSIKSDGFRSLTVGEHVQFMIGKGDDGKTKAVEVTGLNGAVLQGGGNTRDSYGGGGGGRGSRGSGFGFGRGGGGYVGGGGGYGYNGGGRGGGRRGGGGGGGFGAAGGYGGSGGGGYGGGGSGGGCYSCGGIGHLARDCQQGGGRYGGGGGGGSGSCYNCGEQGHFARECPNNINSLN